MSKPWWHEATCEICRSEPAFAFGYMLQETTPEWEAWKATHCEAEVTPLAKKLGDYGAPIPASEFVKMEFEKDVRKSRCPWPGFWKLTGNCTNDTEMYHIEFRRFFGNPRETLDWMAHMYEKVWFDPEDFLATLHRLRAETNSYHKIGA